MFRKSKYLFRFTDGGGSGGGAAETPPENASNSAGPLAADFHYSNSMGNWYYTIYSTSSAAGNAAYINCGIINLGRREAKYKRIPLAAHGINTTMNSVQGFFIVDDYAYLFTTSGNFLFKYDLPNWHRDEEEDRQFEFIEAISIQPPLKDIQNIWYNHDKNVVMQGVEKGAPLSEVIAKGNDAFTDTCMTPWPGHPLIASVTQNAKWAVTEDGNYKQFHRATSNILYTLFYKYQGNVGSALLLGNPIVKDGAHSLRIIYDISLTGNLLS